MSEQRDERLQAQTDYSSHLLTEYEALLHMVRRVDQVHGPFNEFARWREEAQSGWAEDDRG